MCDNDRLRDVVGKSSKKGRGATVAPLPEEKGKLRKNSLDNSDHSVELEVKEEKDKASLEIEAHMKIYEPIKSGLKTIRENVEKMNKLKQKDQLTANEKTRKAILTELDGLINQTTALAGGLRKSFEQIKEDNQAYYKAHKKESAKKQVRENLYNTHLRKFHDMMNSYNLASNEFKQSLQDRTRRQLKFISADITEREVEDILESGKADQVLKEAIAGENLKAVVRDIEDRHLEIIKLEKQVLEVYELFRDLATMVEMQQESFDIISERINHARDFAADAEQQLQEAANYQDKARKRLCIAIILICVAALIIIIPTVTITTRRRIL